jgi:DNA-binding NarL/FixJ family response regulator
MEKSRLTLLLVSDVRLSREPLIDRLEQHVAGTIIGVSDAAGLADQLHALEPDAVLLDVRCRESHEVLRLVPAVRPATRLVAFAVSDDDRDIVACAEAGVSAYVPADAPLTELVIAIQTVIRGDLHLPPQIAAALFRRLAAPEATNAPVPASLNLTARERQILALVVQGLTNKEISTDLHIEVATVKNHVHNLLLKLQVKSRSEAAARVRQGLDPRRRSPIHI